MSSLQAMQLLSKTAHLAQQQKEHFSKQEILQKINEIKYLSAQKKVPRLTLRKEIIHLENQLQGVMELERKLLREKNKESTQVTALKRQIESLKNKLKAMESEELDKKVEKLSYLLGEHLARKESTKEIAATSLRIAPPVEEKTEEDISGKAVMLQKRLEALKHELQIHKELETKNPEELRDLDEKIALIEGKLLQYQRLQKKPVEVRHKLFLPQAGEVMEIEVEKELPLPPPPRMGKKE